MSWKARSTPTIEATSCALTRFVERRAPPARPSAPVVTRRPPRRRPVVSVNW
jgi:hypothetical protein